MTNILLVEDNDGSADMISRMFASHEIYRAKSLQETWDILEGGLAPDMIILDLNLPDSLGGDTYHAVRKRCPEIYTIVYTGLPLDCKSCPLLPSNVQVTYKGSENLVKQLNDINSMLDRLV